MSSNKGQKYLFNGIKYKLKQLVFIFLLFPLFTQCNTTTNSREIIRDRNFHNGIKVQGHTTSYPAPIDTLYPFKYSTDTVYWLLPQWGSKLVMQNIPPLIVDDSIIYRNKAKKVSFFKNKSKAVEITLEVIASEEYEHPRQMNEDWPHLLFEQYFNTPLKLIRTDKLVYKTKCKLLYCSDKMREQFNPDLHTAQFSQYFTIQDNNKDSESYGDFFWFGLPFYDYRYENIELYAAQDIGKDDASNKFIFSVASRNIFDGTLHDKQWITIDKDILPFIKEAFKTAQERGYLTGSKFEDLAITTMNAGWEVPGTFDCGIVLESPSLTAIYH